VTGHSGTCTARGARLRAALVRSDFLEKIKNGNGREKKKKRKFKKKETKV
jgi:hypothetical protein